MRTTRTGIVAVGLACLLAACGSGGAKSSSSVVAPPTSTTASGPTISVIPTVAPTSTTTSTSTTVPSAKATTTTSPKATTTAAPGPKAYSLSASNSGQHETLHPGDTITVTLQANDTTPYGWYVTTTPTSSIVKIVSNTYVPGPCPTGDVGCGGNQVVKLQAVGAGSTSLEMKDEEGVGGPVSTAFSLSFTVS